VPVWNATLVTPWSAFFRSAIRIISAETSIAWTCAA
jgi:hypothetical protein